MERIGEYGKKAKVLRQIMSNQARFYRKINAAQSISTVVVSSLLGFMGFSGVDKIQSYLSLLIVVNNPTVEFIFNSLIFIIFILGTLYLVFQFGKKQTDAENAIVGLTNVINHVDDLFYKEERGEYIGANDREAVRYRYDTTIQHIPANSDRQFLRAKKELQEKEIKSSKISLSPQSLFDEAARIKALKSLILQSSQVVAILYALRKVDSNLYLGGGLVRNLVWDYLHGFKSPTPVDDVDVIYFNGLNTSKQHDVLLQDELRLEIPNLEWSVKNQARMHTVNSDTQYVDIIDAITKWPETATSIIVRINKEGEIELIAPHGLSDLFRLIVRPTPHFVGKLTRIVYRMTSKKWLEIWTKLDARVP